MTLIDFGLIGLVSYIQFRAVPAIQDNTISNYGTEITVVSLGICIYILFVAIIATTRGFKNCKKQQNQNDMFHNKTKMLMYGKVSQENYVELTAASAIPNKEIKSPQILRY